VPPSRSSPEGTVSTGRWVAEASSIARRRCAVVEPGMAVMMWVAVSMTSGRVTSSKRPATETPPIRAPCFAGSSSSSASTVQPWSCRPARRRRAASPAPSPRRAAIAAAAAAARDCS
jgi:hypothetical protein